MQLEPQPFDVVSRGVVGETAKGGKGARQGKERKGPLEEKKRKRVFPYSDIFWLLLQEPCPCHKHLDTLLEHKKSRITFLAPSNARKPYMPDPSWQNCQRTIKSQQYYSTVIV